MIEVFPIGITSLSENKSIVKELNSKIIHEHRVLISKQDRLHKQRLEQLAAAVLVDSIVRLIPGVMNDETSALTDSFQDNLLAPPVYTRPAEYNGWKVPDVLTSGNFKVIEEWRMQQAFEKTKTRRPDLL